MKNTIKSYEIWIIGNHTIHNYQISCLSLLVIFNFVDERQKFWCSINSQWNGGSTKMVRRGWCSF